MSMAVSSRTVSRFAAMNASSAFFQASMAGLGSTAARICFAEEAAVSADIRPAASASMPETGYPVFFLNSVGSIRSQPAARKAQARIPESKGMKGFLMDIVSLQRNPFHRMTKNLRTMC